MGLFEFVRKQFIDIIQWTETGDDLLAWRFPTADFEIQQGARLIVRETQAALFVHEGQPADLFGPGHHVIRTQNLPLLTDLAHWDKLFESPFKSEVYFFSTRLRLNRTWGTANPISIRDPEFGAVRLRAFGLYAYRIADPRVFYAKVSGTRESYPAEALEGQLRGAVVAALTDHVAESRIPFLDLAANQDELAAALAEKLRPAFAGLGLGLETFQIQNISLPEELQKRLDERIAMGVVGDLGRYTRFQAAQAIPVAAAAEGGAAGAGVGVGAGVALGQAMAQALGAAQAAGAAPAQVAPAGAVGAAPGAPTGGTAEAAVTPTSVCGRCARPVPVGAKFCPECGAPQALSCPRCQSRLERPSRFCPECGASLA